MSAYLLNPWVFVQFAHNQFAAVVTGSFVVAAIGAFYALRGNVWLTNQGNARHRFAFELSFHRGERDRLVIANHLGLCVAGWKGNEKRCDQTNERSRAQIKSHLDWMNSAQGVKRADRGDNERAGHDRGQLIMRELHERPRIQKIGAHAGNA